MQFNDCSLNATEWNWEFGDGTNSAEQNPTHIYYSAGNYAVNLTISNENGNVSKSALITVLPENRNGGIEWGPSIKHDTVSSNSISIDDAGHCIEVHEGSGRLFYKTGKSEF